MYYKKNNRVLINLFLSCLVISLISISSMSFLNYKTLDVFDFIWFLVVSGIISITVSIILNNKVVKPLNALKQGVDNLLQGNIDNEIIYNSKNEIGQVIESVNKIINNNKEQVDIIKRISEGDFSKKISYNSENDILSKCINDIADVLERLDKEFSDIENNIVLGDLYLRGKSDNYKGLYKNLINKINNIMNEYTNILDQIPISLNISDTDFNIKYINKDCVKNAINPNVTPEKLLGKKCYDVFGCDKNNCQGKECIAKNEKLTFEEDGEKSGTGVDFLLDLIPRNDKEGNIKGFIETSKNITDIRKIQRILKKQFDFQKNEIDKLISNLESLSEGNLDLTFEEIEYDNDTEVVANSFINLNNSLKQSTITIKSYVDEISDVLNKISNNDFNVEIDRQFKGDFISLKESITRIINHFNKVLLEINVAAEQVEIGAEQVASSSQNLSQGASEQASSVEEISSTVTEVAEQTKENAINANKANDLSIAAKENAEIGNKEMESMLLAMTEIKDSSKNIGNIIKVIDEIAFQTNILALNAAVEAARAGEHGKGFAVVAEEVRNLAARSAQAAKETTEMIDNSITKVEEGYEIANKTAEGLGKIVQGVTDTVEIVGTISEASNQQATAISEIDNGVEQIEKVTQTNTATAEESASASQQMASQAQMLKNLIQEFKLKGQNDFNKSSSKMLGKGKSKLLEESFDISLDDESFGKY